ncbi:MAG: DUF2975 domain-containing protein [Steroidobacteraceae bacterium]
MPLMTTPGAQSLALARMRAFSRPLTVLISIALGLSILVPAAQIVAMLFFFMHAGSQAAFVSFHDYGVGLTIGGIEPGLRGAYLVPLDSLDRSLRIAVAVLDAACAASHAMALLQLRALFSLYSRGIVFAADNVARLKKFALWLVIAAIVVNLSGLLFLRALDVRSVSTANAAMALIYGAMIYVIAHAMALGRAADQESREFV